MKFFTTTKLFILSLLIFTSAEYAQDMAAPLNIQGIDQFNFVGAYSSSVAGSNAGTSGGVTQMFLNPSLISDISKIQFRVGAVYSSEKFEQTQQWTPNRLYAEMSLMFENQDTFGTSNYKRIPPGCSLKKNNFLPSLIAAAIPFTLAELKFTAALSYADFINLNQCYQNNNALDPNIGQMRPAPIPRLEPGQTMTVNWYQFSRERAGNIYGITPAVALKLNENFSFGLSFTLLNGESEDQENRFDRGIFTLGYNNVMRTDSSNNYYTKSGTSKYSGNIINVGFAYRQEYFTAAINIRPPVELKRSWNYMVEQNDSSGIKTYSESGSDQLKFPMIGNLGITIHPSKKMNLSIGYDIRSYSEVSYTNANDSSYKPYVNANLFKVGIEYQAWKYLSVRAGYRQNVQLFVPAGAALLSEPAAGSVYALGLGFKYENFRIDLAYEYDYLKYQDIWLSNVNTNKNFRHMISVEAGYEL